MRGNSYTNKQLLTRLKRHCIEKHLSRYTIANPVWNTYLQRMEKDPILSDKIHNIMALADQWWEQIGIDALENNSYNNAMYARLTSNKAFTKDHDAIDLEEIVSKLEAQNVTKK